MKKRTNIMLSIESEINSNLKAIAAIKGITKTELIENILKEYSINNKTLNQF